MNMKPNVLILMADDMGYSDAGCYGGEIRTPNIDRLAADGAMFTDFHNTPRCSPSRASLLTGLHPHQTGIGILTADDRPEGYSGALNDNCLTLAEMLSEAGYDTAARGKWHLSSDFHRPSSSWPTRRGFGSFWGTLSGCGSYYRPATLTRDETVLGEAERKSDFFYTDAIATESVSFLEEQFRGNGRPPFFLYVAFTAPHWPLHARQKTIDRYVGLYRSGWDEIRAGRWERQRAKGLLLEEERPSLRDPSVPSWDAEPEKEWQAARMAAYAAQVEEMDRAIGQIVNCLERQGRLDDTVVIFLSDNGASDEDLPQGPLERFLQRDDILTRFTANGEPVKIGNDPAIRPGGEDTYQSYGRGWANVSNTPFRLYKLWTHEGGISAPFIVRWPAGGVLRGSRRTAAHQLVDVVPTILESVGVDASKVHDRGTIHPLAGESMLDELRGSGSEAPRTLWWEHCGNGAIRRGRWKLVRQWGWPWELYEVSIDRSERHNRAEEFPDVVRDMAMEWEELSERYGVIPFETTLGIYRQRGLGYSDATG